MSMDSEASLALLEPLADLVGRRGGVLLAGIVAAFATAHQSGVCGAVDRTRQADAQKQLDQFFIVARESGRADAKRLSRHRGRIRFERSPEYCSPGRRLMRLAAW
jgi:hypothetical protein